MEQVIEMVVNGVVALFVVAYVVSIFWAKR